MKRYAACSAYMLLIYGFIFLPVIVLVLFSFQDGRFPVPPLKGLTLKWHSEVLADEDLRAALLHSLVVAVGSSLVALFFGFLAARALAHSPLRGAAAIRGALTAPLSVSFTPAASSWARVRA